MMKRVLCVLLVVFFSAGLCDEPTPDIKTFLQEYKGPKGDDLKKIEAIVEESVHKFVENVSGFPITCLKIAKSFSDDAVIEVPAGYNVINNRGERFLFRACEAFFLENFEQVHTYIDGDVIVNGYQAAFKRTILFLVKDSRCRFVNHGYTTLTFDKNYKIRQVKDFTDVNDYLVNLKKCSFPGTFPYEESTKAKDEL
eukprot:TRINITY_DN717_c0_g1_i7.p1 TRINITY_DN717_c0_g1~~TRINITY_DN717_c0_g1_i7.p1  ORF type:complete len:197 (+),score=32.40 TRINITY_DN717_c0_g1_i7:75-665(+)